MIDKPSLRNSCLRLKVLEVTRTGVQRLELLCQQDEDTFKVLLEGVWTHNNIVKNSIIHLVNPEYNTDADLYTVTNSRGFLVLEPDSLLTCTLVASSLFCERKAWLNQVFLGQVGTNKAMLVGTLVHEVFQYGVKNKIADKEKLIKYLDEKLDDATIMLEIYSVEMHLTDIRNEAISYISSVKEWIEKYMFTGPRYPLTNDNDLEVKIIGVSDIEENVWSTKYGLKGKIDVTGAVRIYDKKTKLLEDKTLPLELKTGNPNLSSSHAAQVSLYSMMIEDRYAETNQGLVIYLKDKAAMHNVTLTHNIKRDLIQRRNQINYHLKSHYFGPEMIDQPRMCKNCERLTECVLMSNLYAPGKLEEYSNMKLLEGDATGHLDERFFKFFQKHHEKIVNIMLKGFKTGKSETPKVAGAFWTYSSEEAEERGTGFGKLQANPPKDKPESGPVKFLRHPKYCKETSTIQKYNSPTALNGDSTSPKVKKQRIEDYFKPAKMFPKKESLKHSNAKPFNTKLNFSLCRVAISLDEDDQDMDSQNSTTAILIGFINELTEDYFSVKIYEGSLDVLKPNGVYRVDKVDKRVNVDIERTVLVRLLDREDWRCGRVRQLILDPKFLPIENLEMNLFVLSTGFEEITEVSEKQQKFVVNAVATDNYYILNEETEPNKKKVSKVVAVLARVIQNLDRSILIVAQNVDDLVDVMKLLQNSKIKFILLDDGRSTKARYQFPGNLVKVAQSENLDLSKKFSSYIRQHELARVVITSYAMSIGGLLFTRRKFDYCVAYDCDKTELLVSLSPMFCSDRYIIVDVRDGNNPSKCDKNDDVTLGDHLRSLRKQCVVID